ncbi:MAG: hypothetical protein ACK5NT_02345 [Pyrinomonadaceae bacterium]
MDNEDLSKQWLEELDYSQKVESFSEEQLILCSSCKRFSPPTRLNCLYCGNELKVAEEQVKNLRPIIRGAEEWKNAISAIVNLYKADVEVLREVAKMTRIDSKELSQLARLDCMVPLARSSDMRELEVFSSVLETKGVSVLLLDEEELKIEQPVTRLRAISFEDKALELTEFNSGNKSKISVNEIEVFVFGTLYERRVESLEKRVKKKENKVVGTVETASDEMVIDFYIRNDFNGFRISSTGFDFSVLGLEKVAVSNANLQKLFVKLGAFCNTANINNAYNEARAVLGSVWQPEERLERINTFRKSFRGAQTEKVITVNNHRQFLRFSRLQRILSEQLKSNGKAKQK